MMTQENRDSLREMIATHWILSDTFEEYFQMLHEPKKIFGGRAVDKTGLREKYQSLADQGHIVMASIWMANHRLVSGKVESAPALLIAGGDGTSEGDQEVYGVMQKLLELSERKATRPDEEEIQRLLADEVFHQFRVRMLPPSFTESEYPVYLFDTTLHSAAILEGTPFVFCLMHPEVVPPLLPLPVPILLPFLQSTDRSEEPPMTPVTDDDPDMLAAIAEARETLPVFWDVFDNPEPGENRFSLKVRITDEHGTEHLWVSDLEKEGETISGTIGNAPGLVQVVKEGDRVEVPEELISDWMFGRDEKMVGNRTLRAQFKAMPEEAVERCRAMMSDDLE